MRTIKGGVADKLGIGYKPNIESLILTTKFHGREDEVYSIALNEKKKQYVFEKDNSTNYKY